MSMGVCSLFSDYFEFFKHFSKTIQDSMSANFSAWGQERGGGTMEMGALGWEHEDRSLGMGAWRQKCGDGSMEAGAIIFLVVCFQTILKYFGSIFANFWAWGQEHGDGSLGMGVWGQEHGDGNVKTEAWAGSYYFSYSLCSENFEIFWIIFQKKSGLKDCQSIFVQMI